jgi:2-amino-4-hydroxy-6-hydroxymethyldihydropteridine diphosphokinase
MWAARSAWDREAMGTLALIGLGSNLGDRKAHLDSAVAALAETPGFAVKAVSSYHETAPVGGPLGQGDFLNAAAAVETEADPLDLLLRLQEIERAAGRVRTVPWSERTLDLDLLLFGDRVKRTVPTQNRVFGGETTQLQIPHPWLPFRRFVLAPLAKIAPEAVDPLTGRTVVELLANLDRRPSYVAILDDPRGFLGDAPYRALIAQGACIGIHYGGAGRLMAPEPYEEERAAVLTRERWESLFESLRGELSVDRLTAAACGDRWVVSDVWFDALWLYLPGWALDREESWERFRAARTQVIQPTFVVTHPGLGFLGQRPHERKWPPPLGDTPVLEVGGDPDAIARKVLAACAATRS